MKSESPDGPKPKAMIKCPYCYREAYFFRERYEIRYYGCVACGYIDEMNKMYPWKNYVEETAPAVGANVYPHKMPLAELRERKLTRVGHGDGADNAKVWQKINAMTRELSLPTEEFAVRYAELLHQILD